jgi:hypothetical protein
VIDLQSDNDSHDDDTNDGRMARVMTDDRVVVVDDDSSSSSTEDDDDDEVEAPVQSATPCLESTTTSPSCAKKPQRKRRSPFRPFKFQPSLEFNFLCTQQEALEEQERLLAQAASRLSHHRVFLTTTGPTFTRAVPVSRLLLFHDDHVAWTCPWARLGLPRDATPGQVKRQYRRLCLHYHPDKNPNNNHTTAHFAAITEAYQLITQMSIRTTTTTNTEGTIQKEGIRNNS